MMLNPKAITLELVPIWSRGLDRVWSGLVPFGTGLGLVLLVISGPDEAMGREFEGFQQEAPLSQVTPRLLVQGPSPEGDSGGPGRAGGGPRGRDGMGRPQSERGRGGRRGQEVSPGGRSNYPSAPGPRLAGLTDLETTVGIFLRPVLRELEHIPTLKTHVEGLIELHQQRLAVVRERQNLGKGEGPRSGGRVREFHGLVNREEALLNEQRERFQKLRNDGGVILEELRSRRDLIAAAIDDLEMTLDEETREGDEASRKTGSELRDLRRSDRILLTLEDRIKRLKDRGSQPERFNRMVRGGLPELLGGGPWMGRDGWQSAIGSSLETSKGDEDLAKQRFHREAFQRRKGQLQREARELQARLAEIQAEIERLDELEASDTTPPMRNTQAAGE